MATKGNHDKSVGEPSSATGRSRRATFNRFAPVADYDDQSDTGGGVNLRDFDSEGNRISTPSAKATTTGGGGAPLHGVENANPAATPISKSASSSRRNTVAPIGAGRFPGYPSSDARAQATMESDIQATINALLKDKEDERLVGQAGTPSRYNMRPTQQTGMTPNAQYQTDAPHHATAHHQTSAQHQATPHHQTSTQNQARAHYQATPQHQANAQNQTNVYPQMGAARGMQYGGYYTQYNAPTSTATSSFTGGNTQNSQATPSTGYSYDSTPSGYNAAQGSYSYNQFTGEYGPTHGMEKLEGDFARMNTDTPSHAPKQDNNTQYQTATPYLPSYNSYQTEPRNFAPRTGNNPVFLPPPPPFNLGGGSTSKQQYNASQATASDSDPFSTPSSPERTIGSMHSQALTLSMVPEEEPQFAMMHNQAAFGPVSAEIRAIRSDQLNQLTEGLMGLPAQDIALNAENFPFIEGCSQAAPVSHGVVKILNIPFGTKRAEIVAFLGRNSKILNDNQEPVHIIMERVTSKTQDVYIEFVTLQDAMRTVERHSTNGQKGRNSRLGDRPVEVQLSSQSALMKDLFPLAAGVHWDGSKPIIQTPIPGQPWKTFKGFVTEEEMTMLVKHVELPQRSPYSKECPQRPYECMISTIKKLPWYMSSHITIRQRHAVYNATVKLITLLIQALQRENRQHETVINDQLLKRLATAAMLCPGFSVVQKDNIAVVAHLDDERARSFNQPRFADMWSHMYALCPKPGVPLDVLEWYIAIIREDTTRFIHQKPITERNEIQYIGSHTHLYFGYMWYEMNLPAGKDFDGITLRELARRELAAMERALRRALPPKI